MDDLLNAVGLNVFSDVAKSLRNVLNAIVLHFL